MIAVTDETIKFLSDFQTCAHRNTIGHDRSNSPFFTFFNCVKGLLAQKNATETDIHKFTLANWSLVHGLAIIITKKDYPYDGNYLELAKNIIYERPLRI